MKKPRSIAIHHERIRDERYSVDWCGKTFIVDNEPLRPDDETRIDAQKKREDTRPIKHCVKCIRNKMLLTPGWSPPELPATMGEFREQIRKRKEAP